MDACARAGVLSVFPSQRETCAGARSAALSGRTRFALQRVAQSVLPWPRRVHELLGEHDRGALQEGLQKSVFWLQIDSLDAGRVGVGPLIEPSACRAASALALTAG